MTIYRASKGNAGIYIRPEQLQLYKDMGYKVARMEEVEVKDIKKEMAENSGVVEGGTTSGQ
ncbi:MAG: hypothetical protein J6M57_10215 [Acidaminococcaceae bacterium]|nr:hypothetical protein [Acidaminococcaceae bacterium]